MDGRPAGDQTRPRPPDERWRTVAGVHVVPVSGDRVVVKRGLTEMLVSGAEASAVVEPLLGLLDGEHTPEEVTAAFPEELAPLAGQLTTALRVRRLVQSPDESSVEPPPAPLAPIYEQLGVDVDAALSRIAAARVAVLGDNPLSRTVAADLAGIGVGEVQVLSAAGLDSSAGTPAPSGDVPAGADLVVAASASGRVDALLGLNRTAVAAGLPFLPAWGTGSTVRIGPLVIPSETACLRCAALLDGDHVPERATEGASLSATAFAGHVVASEAVKYLGGAPSSDVVGTSIRLDLRDFGATVRRVLKAPRCPDCSDAARYGTPAVLAGPQIPMRWAGVHA